MNNDFDITQIQNEIIRNIFATISPLSKLTRVNKTGTIIALSPEIKQGKYDISKYINYGSFNKIIYDFYTVLEDEFSHCDLSVFYKNLKTLKVKTRNVNILDLISMAILKRIDAGTYNTKKNKLTLIDEDDDEIRSIICHELLHMASTKETKDISFSGFLQENKRTKKTIGLALNEGYTEYLNKKYFNSILQSSYENEISIAERLEFIIGKDKMKELYFNANLQGLIDELSKYTPPEHAISIIQDLDKVMSSKAKEESKETKYREIRRELAKIYIAQQRQLLEQGEISEEEFFERKIMYGNVYIAQNIPIPEGTIFHHEGDKIEIIRPDDIIIVDYKPKSESSSKAHK